MTLPRRKRLRSRSAKRAASGQPSLKRSGRPKPKRRSKADRERIYGTDEHIAFVKSLPCGACGWIGASEFAHVKTGGMGRKADARYGAPLCGPHPIHAFGLAGMVEGCHRMLHRLGVKTFEKDFAISLAALAEETEAAWQGFNNHRG